MNLFYNILRLKRIFKQILVFNFDLFSCIFSIVLAYYIRLDITYILSYNDLLLLIYKWFNPIKPDRELIFERLGF